MDIKTLLDIIANQGFPIALSILLIFRIDRFMQEIVIAQKEGYRQVLENTKEIHHTITNLIELLEICENIDFNGIGLYEKKDFLHLDVRPTKRSRWRE